MPEALNFSRSPPLIVSSITASASTRWPLNSPAATQHLAEVIRVAIGKVPNDDVHACLIAHAAAITRFAASDEVVLEIDVVTG